MRWHWQARHQPPEWQAGLFPRPFVWPPQSRADPPPPSYPALPACPAPHLQTCTALWARRCCSRDMCRCWRGAAAAAPTVTARRQGAPTWRSRRPPALPLVLPLLLLPLFLLPWWMQQRRRLQGRRRGRRQAFFVIPQSRWNSTPTRSVLKPLYCPALALHATLTSASRAASTVDCPWLPCAPLVMLRGGPPAPTERLPLSPAPPSHPSCVGLQGPSAAPPPSPPPPHTHTPTPGSCPLLASPVTLPMPLPTPSCTCPSSALSCPHPTSSHMPWFAPGPLACVTSGGELL